jgi:hypothetical protein
MHIDLVTSIVLICIFAYIHNFLSGGRAAHCLDWGGGGHGRLDLGVGLSVGSIPGAMSCTKLWIGMFQQI